MRNITSTFQVRVFHLMSLCRQKLFTSHSSSCIKAEIDALSSAKSAVRKDSPIYKLDPCLEDSFLRVGGRL